MARRNLLKNKKGDATDPMIILIIVLFLAISFIMMIFVNSKIQNIIDTTSLNQSAAYSDISQGLDNTNTRGVQRGFILILTMLAIFTVLSAFLVRQHPAFIFVNIILLGITIFVAVFGANAYAALADNASLAPILEQQSMITFVMRNLVKILIGFGALNMIILFSKLFSAPIGSGDGF